eukprot:TRINITY_DN32130_c0_g1_i1.p1 TRINITY_DN32130_c0_g1~~TRINITY_DN32130_c0_g1_i1.p1  ORF type:complete len:464 (+),score=96.49 TRINITY_DN32130_c0_g1_i1:199-1590(+)
MAPSARSCNCERYPLAAGPAPATPPPNQQRHRPSTNNATAWKGISSTSLATYSRAPVLPSAPPPSSPAPQDCEPPPEGFSPEEAHRCPVVNPVAPNATQVRFVSCYHVFPRDVSGMTVRDGRRKRKPRKGLFAGTLQQAVDLYGAAFLMSAKRFLAEEFEAGRHWYKQKLLLEGPSFTLLHNPRFLTMKTHRITDFWVWHLSQADKMLTDPPVSCGEQPAEAMRDCRRLLWEQQERALQQPDPVLSPADTAHAAAAVVCIVPFYWSREGCQQQYGYSRGHCWRSGLVTTPAEQLRMLRATVRRQNSYFPNRTVVGVCDAESAAAVREALGPGALMDLPVLHCMSQGPRSWPTLRSGRGLPYLLLEYAQDRIKGWGARQVLYNEPDQVLHISNVRALIDAIDFGRYVTPHRLEEWPTGPLRIGQRNVTVPIPIYARALYINGRLMCTTSAGTPQSACRHKVDVG